MLRYHQFLWVIIALCRTRTRNGEEKKPCCSLCVIQIWRGKKREKGDIKKRGKAAGEMREWIMRGLTGRVAGTAERCDSTEEEWETDLGLICISNSPNIQPAMPETCWFALYSSSSVSSLSLSRSHFISISIFPDLMQGFFGVFSISLADWFSLFSVIHSFSLCHPFCSQPFPPHSV